MTAYYNEVDKHAAQSLRNLVNAGLIAPGDVDERDIRDVSPADVAGYTQCHFFAGIGIWSLALRWAGWPDDRPVWSGSCPCQPFSQAGRGAGFADERHLWPSWYWLISQCRPDVCIGEQVASPDGRAWLDLVSSDLEAGGYAVAPAVLCSAGVGAPNIRNRMFWVADTLGDGRDGQSIFDQRWQAYFETAGRRSAGRLADTKSRKRGIDGFQPSAPGGRQNPGQFALSDEAVAGRLGHPSHPRLPNAEPLDLFGTGRGVEGRTVAEPSRPPDPWRELKWLECTDGRFRPTQPGLFPLAPMRPGDVARLRGIGNAINPWVATEFIKAYLAGRP